MSSPSQRSLKLLRDRGYVPWVVEKWIPMPGRKVRQDMYGFLDIVAIHSENGHVVGIQSTTYSNVPARVNKIRESEHLNLVLGARWGIQVHGWRKVGHRWQCREVEIQSQVKL